MYMSPMFVAKPAAGAPAPVIILTGPGSVIPAPAVVIDIPSVTDTGIAVGVFKTRVEPAVVEPTVVT
jgi:hypothetical protein